MGFWMMTFFHYWLNLLAMDIRNIGVFVVLLMSSAMEEQINYNWVESILVMLEHRTFYPLDNTLK